VAMSRFDKITNRLNTNSIKWSGDENELPMWVADMDFEAPEEVSNALIERAAHKIYGYCDIPSEWNEAIVNWRLKRYNHKIDKDDLLYCTSVIASISSTVRKITSPGENIVIQTPVYNIFYNCILNNGRNVLESPLVYEDGVYSIDFKDLEEKLSNKQTSMMILCNPHNPIGRAWSKEELAKIGELCHKYNVVLLADEIRCDLVDPSLVYIPFSSVNEVCKNISITCSSPTKTFNLAGLHTSYIYISNPYLKHKVWRAINTDEVAEANIFAVTGATAAFTYGGAWLDELREYIYQNKLDFINMVEKELPVHIIRSNATYLLWVDCSKICSDTVELVDFIKAETGLRVTAGKVYGECGKAFIRVNIATQNLRVKEGAKRFIEGIKKYMNR
jgi:cystathionine beta-lyase